MTWDADHYLQFADQRTRAAVDLATRIELDKPQTVVDLGCGPGNSTQVLRSCWPEATIIGIDSSPQMIAAATEAYPEQTWIVENAATWSPPNAVDLVYSNAALQWIPNHSGLLPQLISWVAPRGALAFQIPSSTFATVRILIHNISRDPKWNDRMVEARDALTMHPPAFYYDVLSKCTARIDIWETEYQHVMESKAAIIEWISSTGLRPFLTALANDTERAEFLDQLANSIDQHYTTQADGKILFPFRRTFVVAYR